MSSSGVEAYFVLQVSVVVTTSSQIEINCPLRISILLRYVMSKVSSPVEDQEGQSR